MAFSYTGSALNALVDGLTNNAAPVVTLFNDLKTYINGTSWVDDTALVSPNNGTYKQINPSLRLANYSGSVVTVLNSGSTYVLSESDTAAAVQPAGSGAGFGAFYLDPADYTANGRTNKYRLRASVVVNANAIAGTLTFGLYPITATGGASFGPTLTLGAVTAGSTVAFAAPGASSLNQSNSGDFTAPVAGYYAVACAVTVGSTGGAGFNARVILQHRQV